MSNTVRAGNTARGWNDPPEFLHTAEANNTPNNKKTSLNKRVSHTLDGIVAVDNENDKQSKTLSEPPKIPISNIVEEPKDAEKKPEEETPSNLTVEEIESILNSKLDFCKQSDLSAKICDDILKRIKIFVSNWTKLNENVKTKMSSLAKDLESSDLNQANDIHIRLMLDYPSEVSQWMVGIKRLIHELISIETKKNQPE